jgi:hypothetical protein
MTLAHNRVTTPGVTTSSVNSVLPVSLALAHNPKSYERSGP